MVAAGKRVLIVDDNASVRAAIREILHIAGYETSEATDGTEGLARAERLRPDVVLLDVWMWGLDGFEVCRRLKANPATRHIPVVFLTGVEDDMLYSRAEEAGAVACMLKPFHLETFLAVIQAALAKAESQPRANRESGEAGD